MTSKKVFLSLLVAGLLIVFWAERVAPIAPSEPQPSSPHNVELASFFRIFRTPPEHLPKAEAGRVRDAVETFEPAARLSMLQLVDTAHGHLWLLATRRFACFVHARGAACAPKHEAVRSGVLLGIFNPPDKGQKALQDFLLLGLIPNSVDEVLIAVDSQRDIRVAVKRNVFAAAAKDKPLHVKRLLRRPKP